MDKKHHKLIEIINKKITDDSYKVIEKSDFLSAFKKGKSVNEAQLASMMENLQSKKYIDIKYSDKSVICLSVLPKARNVEENTYVDMNQFKKLKKQFGVFVVLSGLVSFLATLFALFVFLGV